MDFMRDNQIVQIFFFVLVAMLGAYLYFGGSSKPKVNTYNFMEDINIEKNDTSIMEEDGFVVTSINVKKEVTTNSIITVIVSAYLMDTCTTLTQKKSTYINRVFVIDLEPIKISNAICQGVETNVSVEFPINMGQLNVGVYKVSIQKNETSFDIEELIREAMATSTPDELNEIKNTEATALNAFNVFSGSLSSGESVQ